MASDLIRQRNLIVNDLRVFGFRQVSFEQFEAENGHVFKASAGAIADHDGKSMLEVVLRLEDEQPVSGYMPVGIPALSIRLRDDKIEVTRLDMTKGYSSALDMGRESFGWEEKDRIFLLIDEWESAIAEKNFANACLRSRLSQGVPGLFGNDLI